MADRGPFPCLHCPDVVRHIPSPHKSIMGEFELPSMGGVFLYECPSCHSNYLTKCMPPEYSEEEIRVAYEEVKRAHGYA